MRRRQASLLDEATVALVGGDFVSIAEAVRCLRPGGLLQLQEGRYEVSERLDRPIHIRGPGEVAIVIDSVLKSGSVLESLTLDVTSVDYLFLSSGRLRDCRIAGNIHASGSAVIERCELLPIKAQSPHRGWIEQPGEWERRLYDIYRQHTYDAAIKCWGDTRISECTVSGRPVGVRVCRGEVVIDSTTLRDLEVGVHVWTDRRYDADSEASCSIRSTTFTDVGVGIWASSSETTCSELKFAHAARCAVMVSCPRDNLGQLQASVRGQRLTLEQCYRGVGVESGGTFTGEDIRGVAFGRNAVVGIETGQLSLTRVRLEEVVQAAI